MGPNISKQQTKFVTNHLKENKKTTAHFPQGLSATMEASSHRGLIMGISKVMFSTTDAFSSQGFWEA